MTCRWVWTIPGTDCDVGCDLEAGHDGPHVEEINQSYRYRIEWSADHAYELPEIVEHSCPICEGGTGRVCNAHFL